MLGTDLGSLILSLLVLFLSLLVALLSLLRKHLVTLSSLEHHSLCLTDPLDVFDEGLLDLIVTHLAIKVFLTVILLLFEFANFLEDTINFDFYIGQIILF